LLVYIGFTKTITVQTLGDSATKHHILKHVFGIVPETIHGPVEITQMLLSGIAVDCVCRNVLDRYLVDGARPKRSISPLAVGENCSFGGGFL